MRQEQLMTRPLDGIALQTYFRRLNLQKDAQDQLIAVRSSPPSRLPDSPQEIPCLVSVQKDAMRHEGGKCQGRVRLSARSRTRR